MSLYSPAPVAMLYTNTPRSSSISFATLPMLPMLQQLSPIPVEQQQQMPQLDARKEGGGGILLSLILEPSINADV